MKICADTYIIFVSHAHAAFTLDNLAGNADSYCCPLSGCTINSHKTAEGSDKAVNDGHTKSKASCPFGSSGISHIERAVYIFKLRGIHADPGVRNLYTEIDAVIMRYRGDMYVNASIICKLETIGYKMPHYLFKLPHIRVHNGGY